MIVLSNKIVTRHLKACGLVIATAGVLAIGCGGGGHLKQLREAASADFNCPKHQVQVLSSGKTRDVDACGNRATYKWEDGDWRRIRSEGGVVNTGAPAVAPAQPAPQGQPMHHPAGTPSQPPPGKQL